MPVSNLLHDFHRQLIVVGCNIRRCENGRHLMLARCDLVMLGLGVNAQLPKLLIQIRHERFDTRANRAKVMILQLLSLRRSCAEQRASGQNQVRTLFIIFLINQEILLLRSNRCRDTGDILAKQLQHAAGFLADCLH